MSRILFPVLLSLDLQLSQAQQVRRMSSVRPRGPTSVGHFAWTWGELSQVEASANGCTKLGLVLDV